MDNLLANITLSEWINMFMVFGTFIMVGITFYYSQITRRQLKQTWRSILIIESAFAVPQEESIEHHLLIRNYGRGPALNVWIYCPANLFIPGKEGSLKGQINLPINTGLVYEIGLLGPAENGKSQVKQHYNNSIFLGTPLLFNISSEGFEPVVEHSLPENVSYLITYEDVDGQKRWTEFKNCYEEGAYRTEISKNGKGVPKYLK